MQHWHNALPQQIYQVQYEALTEDLETTAKQTLDFCGLSWSDSVLEFHKNSAASTTASAAQVRQPVYRSSVARWRHYEKELMPLRRILEEGGVPIT